MSTSQQNLDDTPKRTKDLVQAALNASGRDADADPFRWLQDGWDVIQSRIQWHLDNGRIKQARAWSDASYFFATRYEGKFIAY